jgi:glycosyltransferase involved in cell wall biosynthesis
METADLLHRLSALEADNLRLRTALAEAEARSAASGQDLLLRDGTGLAEEPLRYRHSAVPERCTVILPAYNAQRFLERAVRSVWEQTLPANRIELIVVDDGSTDDTHALASRLAKDSPVRMRVLRHDSAINRGVSPTRQLGAREVTGEFVALLDADDVFLPERLAASVAALRSDPSAMAICSLGRNVDHTGRSVPGHNGTTIAGEWRTLGDGLKPPFTFEQLWLVDPIANSSLTIRRHALERIGGFPALMAHQSEDWLLVLKLSLLAPIPCLDDELVLYTHHADAYTHAYHTQGLREGARLEVFYHAAWWMLRTPAHADAGAKFFRREYPRQIAEHQRFLPLLREYYQAGGRPAEGGEALGEYFHRLTAELETMRRVVRTTLGENKQLRRLVAAPRRSAVAQGRPLLERAE